MTPTSRKTSEHAMSSPGFWEAAWLSAMASALEARLWEAGATEPIFIASEPASARWAADLPVAGALVRAAARALSKTDRLGPTPWLVGVGNRKAKSALAHRDPASPVIFIPSSWRQGHEPAGALRTDMAAISDREFAEFICGHELGHLALGKLEGFGSDSKRVLSLAQEEGVGISGIDAMKAMWPRSQDFCDSLIQSQWRSIAVESFCDCVGAVAASHGEPKALARICKSASNARMAAMSAFGEPGTGFQDSGNRDYDSRAALAWLSSQPGPITGLAICAKAAKAGLETLISSSISEPNEACLMEQSNAIACRALLEDQGAWSAGRPKNPPARGRLP